MDVRSSAGDVSAEGASAASVHGPAGPPRARVLVNFVLFQAGWFVCVLGAARGSTAAALAWGALSVLVSVLTSPRPRRVLLMVAACAALGLLVDGLLIAGGSIRFPADPPGLLGVPFWIAGIWLLFATTLDGCLAWLGGRPWLAFALGAVGSPLSYASATGFGALELTPTPGHVVAVGLGWGLLMPAVLGLARRILGHGSRAESAASRTAAGTHVARAASG